MKKYKLGFNITTYLNTVITKVWELSIISPLTKEMKIQDLCRNSGQNTDFSTRNCCNCTNNHSSYKLLMNLCLSFSPPVRNPRDAAISADFQFTLLPSTATSPPQQSEKTAWVMLLFLKAPPTPIVQKTASTPYSTKGSPPVSAQGHLQLSRMFLIPGSIWAHPSHLIKSISAFCMNKLLISHRDLRNIISTSTPNK